MKSLYKILLGALLCWLGLSSMLWASPVPQDTVRVPRVGLVLSGGGAKGAAHIGVLKYLEEIGMPVDVVVGTSMGSIVGSLYALGYSAQELDSLIRAMDWSYFMSDRISRDHLSSRNKTYGSQYQFSLPFDAIRSVDTLSSEKGSFDLMSSLPSGFISGQHVYNYFTSLCGGYQDSVDFTKDLPIPFACVSFDLVSGKTVVMKEGSLPLAVRSSMAIPGVFAPVRMGEQILVDGMMGNNYPVDVCRQLGADVVIGVDVGGKLRTAEEMRSLPQILTQLLEVVTNDLVAENIRKTDIYLRPDVLDFSAMSFDSQTIDTVLTLGYQAALQHQEALLSLRDSLRQVGKISAPRVHPKAVDLYQDTVAIASIELSGLDPKDSQWLMRKSGLQGKQSVSGTDIDQALRSFYGSNSFSSVTYELLGEAEPYRLVFSFVPSPPHRVGIGFRFDSEETAGILLNLGWNARRLRGFKFDLTGELSYNPWAELKAMYLPRGFAQMNLSYRMKKVDMNMFDRGDVQANILYYNHTARVSLSDSYFKKLELEAGLQYDHYRFGRLLTADPGQEGSRQSPGDFLGAFLMANINTEDQNYFPTRGTRFRAELDYVFAGRQSDIEPFAACLIDWRMYVPLWRGMTWIPALSGRFLVGDRIPVSYVNLFGGMVPGRYVDHQLPFVGIANAETAENNLFVARMDLRQRLGEKHYVSLVGNFLHDSPQLTEWSAARGHWGVGLQYAYHFSIGPLMFDLHWSDLTQTLGYYFSFGYQF